MISFFSLSLFYILDNSEKERDKKVLFTVYLYPILRLVFPF